MYPLWPQEMYLARSKIFTQVKQLASNKKHEIVKYLKT